MRAPEAVEFQSRGLVLLIRIHGYHIVIVRVWQQGERKRWNGVIRRLNETCVLFQVRQVPGQMNVYMYITLSFVVARLQKCDKAKDSRQG